MSTSYMLAAPSALAPDAAVAVRESRLRLRNVQGDLFDAKASLAQLHADLAATRQEEDASFSALCDARSTSNARVRRAADNASESVARQLLELVDGRRQEDELMLSNLRAEAAALDAEADKLTAMLRVQRAETARSVRVLAKEYHGILGAARRQVEDEAALHRERQDLIARTEQASIRHARELFAA
jgi:hypothetical protein